MKINITIDINYKTDCLILGISVLQNSHENTIFSCYSCWPWSVKTLGLLTLIKLVKIELIPSSKFVRTLLFSFETTVITLCLF